MGVPGGTLSSLVTLTWHLVLIGAVELGALRAGSSIFYTAGRAQRPSSTARDLPTPYPL